MQIDSAHHNHRPVSLHSCLRSNPLRRNHPSQCRWQSHSWRGWRRWCELPSHLRNYNELSADLWRDNQRTPGEMMKRSIIALAIATLCGFASPAFAQERTDQLGAAGAISNTDIVPLCQGCSSSTPMVGATGTQLGTFIGTKAVTSIATACQATGGTITTSGTISTRELPVVRTSGNYATSDCGTLVQYNSASDQSPTLPSASSMTNGGYFDTCSIQHAQTITPNSGIPDTIGGASTYSLATGTAAAPTCVRLISNGTSDWKPTFIPGGSSTITAGTTPTSGFTNQDIMYSASSVVADTGIGWNPDILTFPVNSTIKTATFGNLTIAGGNGGAMTVNGGADAGGAGNQLNLTTNNDSNANSSAGDLVITAGNATGTGTSNGGHVIITAGLSTNGTAGNIQLVNVGTATGSYLCLSSNVVSVEATACQHPTAHRRTLLVCLIQQLCVRWVRQTSRISLHLQRHGDLRRPSVCRALCSRC